MMLHTVFLWFCSANNTLLQFLHRCQSAISIVRTLKRYTGDEDQLSTMAGAMLAMKEFDPDRGNWTEYTANNIEDATVKRSVH